MTDPLMVPDYQPPTHEVLPRLFALELTEAEMGMMLIFLAGWRPDVLDTCLTWAERKRARTATSDEPVAG